MNIEQIAAGVGAGWADQRAAWREAPRNGLEQYILHPSKARGFIYVIGRTDVEWPVKIGFSKTPYDRLAELRTGCPFRLSVLALASGDRLDEKWLHYHLREWRLEGEWFRLGAPLLRMLDVMRVRVPRDTEPPPVEYVRPMKHWHELPMTPRTAEPGQWLCTDLASARALMGLGAA